MNLVFRESKKRLNVLKLETGEGFFPSSVAEIYRPLCFEAVDLAMAAIKDRFDQPGYRVVRNLEDLLTNSSNLESINYTHDLNDVCSFYGDDLDKDKLNVQLELLRMHFKSANKNTVELSDLITFLQQ